ESDHAFVVLLLRSLDCFFIPSQVPQRVRKPDVRLGEQRVNTLESLEFPKRIFALPQCEEIMSIAGMRAGKVFVQLKRSSKLPLGAGPVPIEGKLYVSQPRVSLGKRIV